jgi:hypothetical protein
VGDHDSYSDSRSIRRIESVREHPYPSLVPSRERYQTRCSDMLPLSFCVVARKLMNRKASIRHFQVSRILETSKRTRLAGGHLSRGSSVDGAAADGPSRTA